MHAIARSLPALLAIAGAGLWAYHNSFSGPFIFDDLHVIIDNPHIRRLWPLSFTLEGPPGSTVVARPLVALSLALNYAAGGLDVRGYHAVNVALHLLAGMLLYAVLGRLLRSPAMRAFAPGAPGLALCITLIWLVHPLLTETVTYVIQRTELLMAVFYLATLYCAIRAWETPLARRGRWQAAAVAGCLLGLASKEVMVTAPVLIITHDWIFGSRSWRALLRERGRFYLALAATWTLTAVLVATHPRPLIGFHLEELPPAQNALTQLDVLAHYLRLAAWPAPLVIDYGQWPVITSLGALTAKGWLTLLLCAATILALVRRHPLGFAGAWFFVILAPASLTPMPTEIAAERRMYLSLIAPVAVAVLAGWRALQPLGASRTPAATGLAAAAVLVLGSLTMQRNDDYRSAVRLWRDAAAKRPDNARAHHNLGAAFGDLGRYPEAVAAFQDALRLEPDRIDSLAGLCAALGPVGRAGEALPHCQRAVQLAPEQGMVRHSYGVALSWAGRPEEAIEQFRETIRLRPMLATAYLNLGTALSETGRHEEAVRTLEQALAIAPRSTVIAQRLRDVRAAARP